MIPSSLFPFYGDGVVILWVCRKSVVEPFVSYRALSVYWLCYVLVLWFTRKRVGPAWLIRRTDSRQPFDIVTTKIVKQNGTCLILPQDVKSMLQHSTTIWMSLMNCVALIISSKVCKYHCSLWALIVDHLYVVYLTM